MSKLRTWSMAVAAASAGTFAVYAIVLVTGTGAEESASAPVAKKTTKRHVHDDTHARSSTRMPPPSWTPRATVEERRPEDGAPEATEALSFEQRKAMAIKHAVSRESAFVEQFRAEPTNGTFSSTWEPRLGGLAEKRMGALAGFQHIDVECRSERCLGEATWDSYETAVASLDDASQMTSGECATSVYMPEPADPTAAYTYKIRIKSCKVPEE